MKKILLLFLTLTALNSIAQLNIKESEKEILIGEYKPLGVFYGSWTLFEEDNSYLFMFKNEKYISLNEIESFRLSNSESFNQLFDVITETLAKKETKELEIDLNNDKKLLLKFKKKTVSFWYWDGYNWAYTTLFNQNAINKLWGKE